MHFTKTMFASLALSALLFSCDEVEELASFTTNGSFDKTISVSIAEDPDNTVQSFTQATTFNITENQEIQDNLSAIEDITITSLTYEIKNATGNELSILKSASISFGTTSISVDELTIFEADAENIVFQVSQSAVLNAMATAFENNPSLTVTLEGTVENNPIDFDVEVVVEVDVLIQPL